MLRRIAAALATIAMILVPVAADAKPVKDDRPQHSNRIDWD